MRRIAASVVSVLVVFVAACSASTTGPPPSPSQPSNSSGASSGSGSTIWNGTDLLWDAIGGASGFTAVGNSGIVITSRDGEVWRQQKVVTHQTLRGIASNGTNVVAVGTGGAIVTWPAAHPNAPVAQSAGVPITLLGVANGNGTWVVGGSGGTVLTSSDLTHWTEHASGTDGDIFAMAFGAGRFVAVTDTGSIVSSTDGVTWSTQRPADGLWLWDVTYGTNGFFAVGAGGTILQSQDGLTWTPRTSGTTQVLRGVVYGRSGLLAVGSDSAAVSSTNGITWTTRDVGTTGVELWRPAARNSVYLAVGAGGTRLITSDLERWSSGHSTRTAFYGVGSDAATVLAAGVNGTVATRRSDGTWETVATAPGSRELRSVTHLGSTWIATGGGGTILTSSDGTTFTPEVSGSKAELWSSATNGAATPRIVVVGAGGAILVSDDQGQSWRSATDPQKQTLFSVTAGPSGFVAVGVDGAVIRSADGLSWTTVTAGGGQTLRAVSYAKGEYVAVGASGTILTSTDGSTWQTVAPITRLTLRGVENIGGSEWIAVGGGGVVLRSADASSWTVAPSGTDSELFAVTAVNTSSCGAIAVAGVDASITTNDCGATWRLAP